MLYWFYLPPEYRQCLLYYVDLKRVLVGRVPFKVTTRDEVLPLAFSDECTLQTSTELYLLTEDSRDLLFYCIQSQHLSVENVVTTIGSWNSTENSCVVGFSHLPFRCISVLEACNIPVDQVPVQLRAMIDCLEGHFSVESSEDLKEAITYAPSDELQVDGTGLLERVKDEPDGELKVTQETQQNIDEHLLQQAEESPRHDSTPSLRAKGRTRPNSRGERIMSYRKLLSISKSYGELAASKEYANRKLWRALSSRVVPTVLLQCPGCGKYFPQSSPKSLSNMLTHMRSKHFENNAKLLLSISDVLDVLIPFMQKKIALWNRREMRSTW